MDYKQKYFKYKKKYLGLQKSMTGGFEKNITCPVCKLPTKIYQDGDYDGDCYVQCIKTIINDNSLITKDLLKDKYLLYNKKLNELYQDKKQEGLIYFIDLFNTYNDYLKLHLKNNNIKFKKDNLPKEIVGWKGDAMNFTDKPLIFKSSDYTKEYGLYDIYD